MRSQLNLRITTCRLCPLRFKLTITVCALNYVSFMLIIDFWKENVNTFRFRFGVKIQLTFSNQSPSFSLWGYKKFTDYLFDRNTKQSKTKYNNRKTKKVTKRSRRVNTSEVMLIGEWVGGGGCVYVQWRNTHKHINYLSICAI